MNKSNKYYWNNFYKGLQSNFFWPWSDLISLTNRFFKKKNRHPKVLEIGVGNGANISFFLKKNCEFYGIDASDYIIGKLKKRFKNFKKNLFAGNFQDNLIKNKKFDLIFDRGAISCGNNKENIEKIIELIYKSLKKDGLFIGVDWYSKSSTFFKYRLKKSKKTKNFFSYKSGPFKDIGHIYFTNIQDLKKYFSKFKILHIEEKKIKYFLTKKNDSLFSSWSIVVKK